MYVFIFLGIKQDSWSRFCWAFRTRLLAAADANEGHCCIQELPSFSFERRLG